MGSKIAEYIRFSPDLTPSTMTQKVYRGTDYPFPAHIIDASCGDQMRVMTLFKDVSISDKPDLYAFVVQVCRRSESVITTKRASHGIVTDLCEILQCIYGIAVNKLIGTDINSWVVVQTAAEGGSYAFIDMARLPSASQESMGLTAFFSHERTFLDFFQPHFALYTPLVRCFEYVVPWSEIGMPTSDSLYIGPRESFIDKGIDLSKRVPLEWVAQVDLKNSDPILYQLLNAIYGYAMAIPMEHLIANANRFFLMQNLNGVIALVNFVSDDHMWAPIGESPLQYTEEGKFTTMVMYAKQYYGASKEDVTMRLLVYYARLCMKQAKHTVVEAAECCVWLTAPTLEEGDSLTAAILKEKQAQESTCYLLRTSEDTILSIIWTSTSQMYRGMMVTDTHPAFGSAPAFRQYVNENLVNMVTASAVMADTHELMRLLTLWESLFNFVVTDVREYMTKCPWMARDVFLAIIRMHAGKSRLIALTTLLTYIHSIQSSPMVFESFVIAQDCVIFLTMPDESKCLAVNAFHAVMGADPDQTAREMSNNAFQLFLAGTIVSEKETMQVDSGQVPEAQETDECVSVVFPNAVLDADKATLYQLLKSRGLHHLFVLSPFVPAHQSWLSIIAREVGCEDILSMASKARLVGMTQDLVVYVFDSTLYVTVMNDSTDSAMGLRLVMAVVNTYNTLVLKGVLVVTDVTYTVQEAVVLFRAFNVGYRSTNSGGKVIDPSLLRKAIVYILFGIYPTSTSCMEAVWSDMVDFLLSGAISHRTSHTHEPDNDVNWDMEVEGADNNADILNMMKMVVHVLYLDRVQAVEVVAGSIYVFQGAVSSAFMVAQSVLKTHENIIRNVNLSGVHTDDVTISVLASIVIASLYGEFSVVQNLAQLYDALISRHQSRNIIPFIVRQILRVVWSEYLDHVHFPDVEYDSQKLISTWERNIADKLMAFPCAVVGVVLVDGPPKDSATVVLDHTVSVIMQNGVGSEKPATLSLLITGWPLAKEWKVYIHIQEVMSSELNAYKGHITLQPVSSLLYFGQQVAALWEWERGCGFGCTMRALLPDGRCIFMASMSNIVHQITEGTAASHHDVVKVMDKVLADDGVSPCIAGPDICGLQLVSKKKQNNVLTIFEYPFALLDQSIALHFDSVSQMVDLNGPIDSNLLLITDTLMHETNDPGQSAKVISNPRISDWLLACMPMIAVEKQRKASYLCLSGMLNSVPPFWRHNGEDFETSVLGAVKQLPLCTVTNEIRRQFLWDVFIPFMEIINRQHNVGACVLLPPSSSQNNNNKNGSYTAHRSDTHNVLRLSGYTVVCTEHTMSVGLLHRGMNTFDAGLAEWLTSIRNFLQDTPVDSSIEDFVASSREKGADPIQGETAAHVFENIPTGVYTQHPAARLVDIVTRASVLNAWTRDVPAVEIYTRNHLIATGRELATIPCIDTSSV